MTGPIDTASRRPPTRRPLAARVLLGLIVVSVWATTASGQDLIPGAYAPAPTGINIITIGMAINHGDVAFDPSLPVDNARATIGAAVAGAGRTLSLAGRFASLGVALPFLRGHVEGQVLDQVYGASRSGLGDLGARIAINLYGAPAMTLQQFATYRPTTIIGVSLNVTAPIGQYNPAQHINLGTNRWSFKPEAGFARTRGLWTIEADLGAVFFTANTAFVGGRTRQQAPILSAQGHLIRAIRPGFWVAADGNFWRGGRTTVDGAHVAGEQRNSRVGLTLAVPVRRQQLRVSYSLGAFTTTGGDFHSIGLSYNYAWMARP